MTGVMLSGAAALLFLSGPMAERVESTLTSAFRFERGNLFDASYLPKALGTSLEQAAVGLVPLAVILIVAVFASAVLIGGWSFSFQAAAPKGNRINPINGMKRIFSANSVVELTKALAKFGVVLVIAVFWLWWSVDELLSLGRQPILAAIPDALRLCAVSLLVVSTGLIFIAGIDVPFQLWNYQKKLRMTRQEVRDEFKETEGRPEVKSRIRLLQQQVATRRMMEEVPTADVVITNPTHFAVAIRYDDASMGAPRVVAKGKDLLAARIREIADEHRVPQFSAPPLARALYRSTKIGQEIPTGLYNAVAQVLAYIFRIRDGLKPGESRPEKPVPDVDESLY